MVTSWSPAIPAGGVNTVIRSLSRLLEGEQSAHILVNEWEAPTLKHTSVDGLELNWLRLRCPPLEGPWFKGFIGWLRDFPRALVQLRRFVKDHNIAIVHVHFASDYQYYFRILRFLTGVPYVVTFHRGDVVHLGERPPLSRLLTRWVVSGADRITSVSKWLATEAATVFPKLKNVEIVYNGLDFTQLEVPDQLEESGRSPVEMPADFVLIVSNVAHYKGQDIAIRAWGELKEELPDLHLVIVGEARDLWQPCHDLIRDLGCEDRIHMMGALPHHQVVVLMRHARALLFPSRNEGLGIVLLEAGALGLPVICSDIPPFREMVEPDRNALVVPPEDPGAIARAVVRLTSEPALGKRLAQALRERVMADFTGETMASRYLKVYADVLATRRKG